MKIQRIFLSLCSSLLAAHAVSAQQYMWMLDSKGALNVNPVTSVTYTTFNFNANWFDVSIKNDGIDGKTTSSVSASCTVALSVASEIKSYTFTPEIGVCYSIKNVQPTVNDMCKTLGSEAKSYSFILSALTSGTTYYYRIYVKLADFVWYGDVVSVKILGTKPADNSKTINGHKFIDLGLPSGLLWAETNIGAATAVDDGDYFAWGETEDKLNYSWSTYKYGTSEDNITKYDSLLILDKEDDAAYVNWGDSCRLPKFTELFELNNSSNCIWIWTSSKDSSGNSINGYEVTSIRNGNSIFLPAAGYREGHDLFNRGSSGYYWTRTLASHYTSAADWFFFGDGYHICELNYRYFGYSIRPVAEP